MSELSDLWDQYKEIEKSGDTTGTLAKKIEKRIHEIQKGMSTSRYDFDKRRERHAVMATPSISGPPKPDSKVEEEPTSQHKLSYEEARAKMSDNDFELLEGYAEQYEIRAVVLAEILNKLNPENRVNPARRGQGINWALTQFFKEKSENNGT